MDTRNAAHALRVRSRGLPAVGLVALMCVFQARAQAQATAAAPSAPTSVAVPADAGAPTPAKPEAPPASAAQKQALVLLDQALTQAERAEWHDAVRTLEQARALAEFPNIVFHLARARFRLHDTERGLQELARFEALAGAHNPNRAEAERLRVEHNAPAPVAASAPAYPPERRPSVPLGPVLTISGGGVALLTGLITGLLANAAHDELERNCDGTMCPSYLESVRDRGDRLKLATNVLLAVGGAAVVVGTSWWLLGRRNERARAQLACSGEGCRASAQLQF